jgi:peptidoglycan/xylan/chitin deacetylase (PgdA/CDA1 family)
VTDRVCLTVDVEDWYDGMEVLGAVVDRPRRPRSGLAGLAALLASAGGSPTVTLFVVGGYATTVRTELEQLAAGGHEIASHGPDHGRLPDDPAALLEWLRRGREMIEDVVQRPVRGFRSPRFDIPEPVGLDRFRQLLAEAGFTYVSDTRRLGDRSPLTELPVLTAGRVPIGGGSYQRLLPSATVDAAVRRADAPAVLYYHSYDFGATLPAVRSIRSPAVAKQLVGRGRVAGLFSHILQRYGSEACSHVQR